MNLHRPTTAALGVLVSLGLLTACGGHSPKASSSPSPPASTAPSVTTTPPSNGPTTRVDGLLQQVNLVSADLPTGWTGTPASASPSSGAEQAALVKCAGGRNTTADKTLTYYSDSFTSGASTITSSASDYKTQADVTSDTALLHSRKISACYQALATAGVKSSLPAGTTFVSAALRVQQPPAGAPKNVAAVALGKIVVRSSGHLITLYQTTAFITGRLLEAQVNMQGVDTPVDESVQEKAIDVVAIRASQA